MIVLSPATTLPLPSAASKRRGDARRDGSSHNAVERDRGSRVQPLMPGQLHSTHLLKPVFSGA
jgi:hypothetical protein